MGALLHAAKFALPTVDVDTIAVQYVDPLLLMEELQLMGEGNVCVMRRERVSRDTFVAAAAAYEFAFGAGGVGGGVDDCEDVSDGACENETVSESVSGRDAATNNNNINNSSSDDDSGEDSAATSEEEEEEEGSSVRATFQVLYMIGWAPHASQQQPKERGSATTSFKDLDTL